MATQRPVRHEPHTAHGVVKARTTAQIRKGSPTGGRKYSGNLRRMSDGEIAEFIKDVAAQLAAVRSEILRRTDGAAARGAA